VAGATQTLTVSNTGTGTLRITNTAISGAGAGAYSVTPSTLNVPGGQSGTLTVTFTPAVEGPANATLTLTTNDVARQSVPVTLSGTGIRPTISVPNALAFGEQPVGAPALTRTLTVSNTGTGTLSVSNIVLGGSGAAAYSFTPGTLSVPATESRTLTVTFNPTAQGAADATLTLTTNDVARETVTVNLSGTGTNPIISVPNSLAFGEHPVGAPALTQMLTVNNTGTGTLRITNIAISGPGAAAYTFTPSTLNVPGGQSGTLSVTFTPTAQGTADATLTLTTNDVARDTVTVALSGIGINPIISVPSSLAFAEHRVGVPGATQTLTVSNTGTGTLRITNTALSGAGAAAYSVTPSTLNVPSGQSGTLSVTFTPAVEGPANATLTLTTNDVARQSVPVTLSGTGIRPTISVPNALAFGEQPVGAPALTRTLTVSNTGTGTLSVSNIVLGGSGAAAYSFTPGTLSVPQGESRNLTVTFNPTAQGAADATLTLTTNDVARQNVPVNLSGTGTNPIISVPNSLAFGEQSVGTPSATRTLTVSNTGTGTLRITNIALTGTGAAAYGVTPSTLSVPQGESRNLTVTFNPTAQGAVDATLTLTTNDVARQDVPVALSGIGIQPIITVPGSLAFGDHRVGVAGATQTLTVSNTGTGTLRVTNTTLSGTGAAAYSITPSTLEVPATETRTLTVTFTPATEGAANATLTMATNDAGRQTVTVALSGTGIRPTISVPGTLAFGEQPVGAPALTRTLTVSNTGTGTLSVSNIALGGSSAAAYSFTPDTLSVPQGESRNLTVTFNPPAQGAANATLTLTTNDVARQTVTVTLSGTGINPVISVPSSLAFGDQRVGAPAATRTLTVGNSGTGTLRITNIVKSGPGATAYTFTPSTLDVSAGQTATLSVTFAPSVEGAADATLTLTTNDVSRQTVVVTLSGMGVRPTILVPGTVAFGEQSVGVPGATRPLTVSNTGTGTLRITNIAKSGPGAAAYTFTPSTLDVSSGEIGVVSVTFTPTSQGPANATLTLTTNDVANPSVTVNLSGTGIQPTISVSPTSLSFGDQRIGAPAATRTLTVTNTGTGNLVVSNITATGPGAAAYSFMPSTLSVPANESRTLTVSFDPPVEGIANATLTLTTNDVAHPSVTVNLSGTGIRPAMSVTPNPLNFGDVPVNGTVTQTLAVSNTGSGTLSITSITKSGAGAAFYTFMPATLDVPAGQSRTLSVTFTPTVEGQADAFLTLTTNEVQAPSFRVDLSGYGGRPTALMDPSPLNFGGVRRGATNVRTVRLSNTGRAPLSFTSAPVISSGPFVYQGPSSATITAGGFLDFQVAFSPTSNISYSATLTLTSNATNSQATLSMTGFGADPQLNLNPTSIFFGDARVGTESARVPVTVSNSGNAPLIVQSLPVTGRFAVLLRGNATLPKEVVAGSPFTFDVVFRPAAEGAASGKVDILTDLNPTTTPTVALSGNGTVSRVELSPNPSEEEVLAFGEQRVAQRSGVLPVIVTNRGQAELEISEIIFSNAAFTITSPALPTPGNPLRIGAGEQRALSVVFTPATLGAAAGRLSIISNAFTAALPLDLSGTGVDGQMSVTPSSVSFATADVGGSGVQQSVVLKNVGRYPLTIEQVNAPLNPAFTVAGLPNGLVLQPNDTWPFTVTFTPRQRGYVSTTAIIESDAVTNPLLNLAMAGTGVAAAVELQPENLTFGNTNVSVPVALDLSIKNVGERDLSVSNISFVDDPDGAPGSALDFSLDSGVTLPLVVAPGQSTLVRLKFTPRVIGLRKARARVFTNDTNAEATLVGVGTAPQLKLTVDNLEVSSLSFGNVLVGTPSNKVIRITNTGNGPLTLSTMSVAGPDAAAFIMTPPTLPTTLQPEGFAEVSVSVRPDAERQLSAQFSVLSNDPNTPNVTLPMSAVGVRQQIQLSPLSLDFGRQLLNNPSSPRTVTVKNSSASRVTLSALSVEGTGASQFTLVAPPLPKVLEAGAEVELGAIFTAVAEGNMEGKLKITFSEPPLQLEVSLFAQGISSVLSIRPTPLDFGAVRAGGARREQPVTIANLSSETITLAEPEVKETTGEAFNFDTASLRGLTIAPGSSIIRTVGYQPQRETLSETTLFLGTTVPPRPRSAELALRGRATLRLITADPGSLDFGRVDVGAPVQPREITVVNKSAQQQRVVVKLRSVEGTAFTVDAKTLADPIPAGGSVTFTVTFVPLKAGAEENEVQVWLQNETEPEALIAVTGHGRSLMGEGGGCSCSSATTGSAGMLALLALLALAARRRRE
jgi:MYXO-CTERM domain-containing protein